MALNATSFITVLNSMNYTADCSIATTWLTAQSSPSRNNTVNIAYLQSTLPTEFKALSGGALDDLYEQLSLAKASIWLEPATESIQIDCLASELANNLRFEDFDLAGNCASTVAYYGNTICAINGPQKDIVGWLDIVDPTSLDYSTWTPGPPQWVIGKAPAQGLSTTSGVEMLRNALLFQYKDISDLELKTWGKPDH